MKLSIDIFKKQTSELQNLFFILVLYRLLKFLTIRHINRKSASYQYHVFYNILTG